MTLWLPLSNILLLFLRGFINLVLPNLLPLSFSHPLYGKLADPAVLSYSLRLPRRGGNGLIAVFPLRHSYLARVSQSRSRPLVLLRCVFGSGVFPSCFRCGSSDRFPMFLKHFFFPMVLIPQGDLLYLTSVSDQCDTCYVIAP